MSATDLQRFQADEWLKGLPTAERVIATRYPEVLVAERTQTLTYRHEVDHRRMATLDRMLAEARAEIEALEGPLNVWGDTDTIDEDQTENVESHAVALGGWT